jgi:hypothetical protein
VFDREEQDSYTLVIQATDNPLALVKSNQLSDSILIKIRILDLNDNEPECEQDEYRIELVQNVDTGTILMQIKGVDDDIGRNARLSYHIKSNNKTTSQLLGSYYCWTIWIKSRSTIFFYHF